MTDAAAYGQTEGPDAAKLHPMIRSPLLSALRALPFGANRAKHDDPLGPDTQRLAHVSHAVLRHLEQAPNAQKVICAGADLFTVPDFAERTLCQRLVRAIDREATPSTLFQDAGTQGYRTSSTHYFSMRDPLTAELEARISALMGIDDAHSEMIQGQRYEVGQEYKHHQDTFQRSQPHWQKQALLGGQRTWTAMLFLNAPEQGGETDFPKLGLSITPVPGTLVIWNNITADGKPNPRTLHAGTPVVRGVKHVLTKWYRVDRWRDLNADVYR